jgi:hypothetical protein
MHPSDGEPQSERRTVGGIPRDRRASIGSRPGGCEAPFKWSVEPGDPKFGPARATPAEYLVSLMVELDRHARNTPAHIRVLLFRGSFAVRGRFWQPFVLGGHGKSLCSGNSTGGSRLQEAPCFASMKPGRSVWFRARLEWRVPNLDGGQPQY